MSSASSDPTASAPPGCRRSELDDIVPVCRSGLELASRLGWQSYDPFDLLLAPFGELVRCRSRLVARMVVQLGTRSGPRLRRAVRVRHHEEAKAVADLMLSAVLLSELGLPWPRSHVESLGGRLANLAVEAGEGLGWGLGFPYASRFVSVPARTPNAYTTVCCVAALSRAARNLDDPRLLDLATMGARMITSYLGTVSDGSRSWFRYWPGDDTCIVNVQALIAGAFQELAIANADERLADSATIAARMALDAQRANGSFPYAIDRRGQFIDAFHTGFVLEGLTRFRLAGGHVAGLELEDQVGRGLAYLQTRLVAPSQLPRSKPDGVEARDAQNIGQLVQTLAICGQPAERELALEIWRRWVAPAVPDQHPAAFDGRLQSLRWGVAPIVLAGAHLATQRAAHS